MTIILLAASLYLGLMVHYTGGYGTLASDMKAMVRPLIVIALVPVMALLLVVFCIQYRIGYKRIV